MPLYTIPVFIMVEAPDRDAAKRCVTRAKDAAFKALPSLADEVESTWDDLERIDLCDHGEPYAECADPKCVKEAQR
jgi:hypothetical protein